MDVSWPYPARRAARVQRRVGRVGPRERRVGVHGVVAVVEALHPVVIELEVPAAARRRTRGDAQHEAGRQSPVRVVVPDVRVAARLVAQ